EGSNPNVELQAKDEVSFYYCYGDAKNPEHTIVANAFRKVLYKNLYQGIDVEYSFPENKFGIEYALIVHPGADLSKVKLLYKGADGITTDATGNVKIETSF